MIWVFLFLIHFVFKLGIIVNLCNTDKKKLMFNMIQHANLTDAREKVFCLYDDQMLATAKCFLCLGNKFDE